MAFRFQKRIKILPGVFLNLSKSGASVSVGPQGAKLTVGSSGARATFGVPGTGISYTHKLDKKEKSSGTKSKRKRKNEGVVAEEALEPNFFERLTMSGDEEQFVTALSAFVKGDHQAALAQARQAAHVADGAFLAGVLAMEAGLPQEAAEHFHRAMDNQADLNQYFSKYGVNAQMSIEITDEVQAYIEPNARGVALALAEVYQVMGRTADAIKWMQWLAQQGADVVVRLSLAELVSESDASPAGCQYVVNLAEGVTNETPIHTALLYYKGKALGKLGFLEPACQCLTDALKRKKDRSAELMAALRYERGLMYEAMGDKAKAKKDFEAVYAEAPNFADVAMRVKMN